MSVPGAAGTPATGRDSDPAGRTAPIPVASQPQAPPVGEGDDDGSPAGQRAAAPTQPAVGEVLAGEVPQWPITIGVALPIPEPFLAELGAFRERFGDPLAHAIVAHVTLVPPMRVGDECQLARVLEHLSAVTRTTAPFPVVLAGSDSFRPVSPVVFVPLVEGEPQTRALEERVRRGPLDRPLAFPYHPHVTVAHDLEEQWLDQASETMRGYRASFDVESLGLFVQGADGVWRQRVDFPFRG